MKLEMLKYHDSGNASFGVHIDNCINCLLCMKRRMTMYILAVFEFLSGDTGWWYEGGRMNITQCVHIGNLHHHWYLWCFFNNVPSL